MPCCALHGCGSPIALGCAHQFAQLRSHPFRQQFRHAAPKKQPLLLFFLLVHDSSAAGITFSTFKTSEK